MLRYSTSYLAGRWAGKSVADEGRWRGQVVILSVCREGVTLVWQRCLNIQEHDTYSVHHAPAAAEQFHSHQTRPLRVSSSACYYRYGFYGETGSLCAKILPYHTQ